MTGRTLRAGLGQGKVSRRFLERVVFSNLGAARPSVLVKPGHGLDNAVVSLGGKKVLIVTTDPLSLVPALGPETSAWESIHLVASDLATSGVAPQFAAVDLNLPPDMELYKVGAYVRALGTECKRLGVAIVGGHTGRYPGSGLTVVGGATMFSLSSEGEYVTPAMAREGDAVVITKGAAIGASAVLSRSFPSTVRDAVGPRALSKAMGRIADCSSVADALTAASVGLRTKVTAMHDATEGGVLGGLEELSSACGLPILAVEKQIHVPGECAAVCEAFGLDPLTTLSEGTLIITCRPDALEEVRRALSKKKIGSFHVGRVGSRRQGEGLYMVEGARLKRHRPARDRYWEAYASALVKERELSRKDSRGLH